MSIVAPMNRDDVIRSLHKLMPEIRNRFKVRGLSLFGSVVRDEARAESDIDVLVDFDDQASFFDLVRLGIYLEEKLQRKVDVVPRRAVRAELREPIFHEAVTV